MLWEYEHGARRRIGARYGPPVNARRVNRTPRIGLPNPLRKRCGRPRRGGAVSRTPDWQALRIPPGDPEREDPLRHAVPRDQGPPHRTRPPGPLAFPSPATSGQSIRGRRAPPRRPHTFKGRTSEPGDGRAAREPAAHREDAVGARELVHAGALRAVHGDQGVGRLAGPVLDRHAGERLAGVRAFERQSDQLVGSFGRTSGGQRCAQRIGRIGQAGRIGSPGWPAGARRRRTPPRAVS